MSGSYSSAPPSSLPSSSSGFGDSLLEGKSKALLKRNFHPMTDKRLQSIEEERRLMNQ